uniref:JAKMIP_CC3 domain-containing protein n=1 Tax=Macrostomum lignano TaxID=282301 RepID=A0A1I8FFN2_9PLAT
PIKRKVADLHEQLESPAVIAADNQLRLERRAHRNIQCELDNAKERICQLEADAAAAAATAAAAAEPEPSAATVGLSPAGRKSRAPMQRSPGGAAPDARQPARQAAEQASESIANGTRPSPAQSREPSAPPGRLRRRAAQPRCRDRSPVQSAESEAANKLRELRTKSELELAELQDQLPGAGQYRSNRQRSGAELRASAAAREEVQREVKAVTDRLTKELEAAEEELKASKAERRKGGIEKKPSKERNEEAEMKERLLVRCQELEEPPNIPHGNSSVATVELLNRRSLPDEQRASCDNTPAAPPLQSNRVHQLVRANSDVNNGRFTISNNASNNGCSALLGAQVVAAAEKGGQLSCEDEDAHLLEWKRIAELQQRNQRQLRQLAARIRLRLRLLALRPASSAVASRSTSTIATSALTSTLASTWSSTSAAQQQQQQQPPPPPQRQRLFKSPKSAAPRLALTTSAAASTRPKNTSASMSTLQHSNSSRSSISAGLAAAQNARIAPAMPLGSSSTITALYQLRLARPNRLCQLKKTLVYSIEMNPGRPGPRRDPQAVAAAAAALRLWSSSQLLLRASSLAKNPSNFSRCSRMILAGEFSGFNGRRGGPRSIRIKD